MAIRKRCSELLDQFKTNHLSNSMHLYTWIGAAAFFGFPLLFFAWHISFPNEIELIDFKFKLIGSLFGFGLMTCSAWPDRLKKHLPWFWLISLIYIFPFFFTYGFLISQANDVASMALLSSVFLMVLLTDVVSLILALTIGILMAFITYMIQNPDVYLNQEHFEVVMLGLFFMVAGTTLNYRTTVLNEQRMKGMAAVAGMIAHELRTPLLGIKSGAKALDSYIPELIEGYLAAEEKGLLNKKTSKRKLKQLALVNQRIISETNYANTIIDMLLVKAGGEKKLLNCEPEICSMADVLDEVMQRYPFRTESERSSVHWQGSFNFFGSKLLMAHVLFNLLKNALYIIKKSGKGNISIWTSSDDNNHCLFFKDTAGGMSAKQVKHLFDHFYTTTFMGTGIGLSYCKMVMEQFGGQIECEAQEGDYTLFKLKFPRVVAEKGILPSLQADKI